MWEPFFRWNILGTLFIAINELYYSFEFSRVERDRERVRKEHILVEEKEKKAKTVALFDGD